MQTWLTDNTALLIIFLLYFICEILAHTTKIKANSLFQLIFGWLKQEKQRLAPEKLDPAQEYPKNKEVEDRLHKTQDNAHES